MSHPMQLQLQLQLIASCFFVPCSFLQVSMQVSIMYKSTTISSFSTANHLETSYGLWRLFDLYLFIFVIVQGFCKNSFVMCFMKCPSFFPALLSTKPDFSAFKPLPVQSSDSPPGRGNAGGIETD
ncbi:hypothetical protein I7I51_01928 [Histoplasma capsulatum]|uniref:Uncharacterized protein n=1 Tax=Ajellomyces capsulatus TaxID=5037 RepID=A0A8A1MJR7_AJECA|nr:hypothetical protein I7I51_01928 [Histoplasma capsulatum]